MTSVRAQRITNADYEAMQKRVSTSMRANADSQLELLRALSTYRLIIEQLATASDKVAQVAGKFAICSASSYQLGAEIRTLTGRAEVDDEVEARQQNLLAALAQMVKFHTKMGAEQGNIANRILNNFERPVQLNNDKFRDMVSSWVSQSEREMRKHKQEVKAKTSQATKAGRKQTDKEMTMLSLSLTELADKMEEMDKARTKRLEDAILTDCQQYLLVAHHLQQVLRTEVASYRAVYYDGTHMQKKTLTPVTSVSPNFQQLPPLVDTDLLERAMDFTTPVRSSPPSNSKLMPRSATAPNFQTSSVVNSQDVVYELDDHTGEVNIITSPGMQAPPRKQSMDELSLVRPPIVPKNPHRKTMAIPKNVSGQLVNQIIKNNFPAEGQSTVPRDEFDDEMDHFRRETEFISVYNNTPLESSELLMSGGTTPVAVPQFSPMAGDTDNDSDPERRVQVMYEYQGDAHDDLNVLAGDTLKVIAVEGEWLYGWLLLPSEEQTDRGELTPAEIDGVPQLGWVPLKFVKDVAK